ncbi:MAG: flavin reductase [Euryarchaeota archaeon]|nr:flavin reductase [Euryarchaeota archaeon]MDE1835988.1 flavin reductase [Euryarchaeota archaeon]MDE1880970.1 flavin reductase [Euryarchaeota archaeon]MDE2046020.1 flavin reductase [Thermoplasmata archaeon]
MGRFATGVTVVTAHHRGVDAGMTVNAFVSVTLEPPTVLICLNRRADTTPVVEASGKFAITILSARERHLSELFASRAPSHEKFQGVPLHRGTLGPPLLDGGLGSLECEVVHRVEHGSHVLFFGQVVALETGGEELPLVFWKSEYARPSQGGLLVMCPSRNLSLSSKGSKATPKERKER